jgi:hypothetical protein
MEQVGATILAALKHAHTHTRIRAYAHAHAHQSHVMDLVVVSCAAVAMGFMAPKETVMDGWE